MPTSPPFNWKRCSPLHASPCMNNLICSKCSCSTSAEPFTWVCCLCNPLCFILSSCRALQGEAGQGWLCGVLLMGKCFFYRLEPFHIAKLRCAVGCGDTQTSGVGTNHLCGHITESHIKGGKKKQIIQRRHFLVNLYLSHLQTDYVYSRVPTWQTLMLRPSRVTLTRTQCSQYSSKTSRLGLARWESSSLWSWSILLECGTWWHDALNYSAHVWQRARGSEWRVVVQVNKRLQADTQTSAVWLWMCIEAFWLDRRLLTMLVYRTTAPGGLRLDGHSPADSQLVSPTYFVG